MAKKSVKPGAKSKVNSKPSLKLGSKGKAVTKKAAKPVSKSMPKPVAKAAKVKTKAVSPKKVDEKVKMLAKKTDKKIEKKIEKTVEKTKESSVLTKKMGGKKEIATAKKDSKGPESKSGTKPSVKLAVKAEQIQKQAAKEKTKVQEKVQTAEPKKAGKKEKAVDAAAGSAAPTEIEIEQFQEVILTDADGNRFCRGTGCDQLAAVENYCRYHYLLFWKKIQARRKILSEGKLESYIQELTARYPDKYLEMLRKDLKSEKDFLAAVQELEIDDSGVEAEYEDEAQSYIEEVRGGVDPGAREEEDY